MNKPMTIEYSANLMASVFRVASALRDLDRATRAESADRLVLYRVTDHCDLEWRMQALDRRRALSGSPIGGAWK